METHLGPGQSTFGRIALELIVRKRAEALKVIEENGFVFDDIGKEPGNWQHLAFTLYTELCEIELIARHALEEE